MNEIKKLTFNESEESEQFKETKRKYMNKRKYVENKRNEEKNKKGLSPLVGLGWMQGSDLRESLRTSDKILRVLLVTLHSFSAYTRVGNLR